MSKLAAHMNCKHPGGAKQRAKLRLTVLSNWSSWQMSNTGLGKAGTLSSQQNYVALACQARNRTQHRSCSPLARVQREGHER